MIAISLQSGSNGNSIYVETQNVKLIFDAGISGVQAERRLAAHHRNIRDVDAVFISHDHNDHIRSAGIFSRKYGLPVYASARTIRAASSKMNLGRFRELHHFQSGEAIELRDARIETISTPHDAVDGVAFVVSSGGKRLGLLTDLGHAFAGLTEVIASLNGVFIESNFDEQMLEKGPYPWPLKRRIAGPGGHLSNADAADLLKRAGGHLDWACLAHLSEQNNTPECALQTHRRLLGNSGRTELFVASRYHVGEILEL